MILDLISRYVKNNATKKLIIKTQEILGIKNAQMQLLPYMN